MLYSPGLTNTSTIVPDVDGRELSRRLRKLTPAERAILAFDLQCGSLIRPTPSQAAAVTKASIRYVNTISRATAEERELLECGRLSVSALHSKYRRPVTDADIERFVVKIGLDRVWRALDRVTAPELPLVAAE